jgi:hypothetical protein
MRLTQFMLLAEDRGCVIQVDDGGEISIAAQQGRPGSGSNPSMVVLPLSARDAQHLTMWLTMAIRAANGTTASGQGGSAASGA